MTNDPEDPHYFKKIFDEASQKIKRSEHYYAAADFIAGFLGYAKARKTLDSFDLHKQDENVASTKTQYRLQGPLSEIRFKDRDTTAHSRGDFFLHVEWKPEADKVQLNLNTSAYAFVLKFQGHNSGKITLDMPIDPEQGVDFKTPEAKKFLEDITLALEQSADIIRNKTRRLSNERPGNKPTGP